MNAQQKRDFAQKLCRWQESEGRQDLPWTTRDPYRRWLSEIMLQQTQVSVVRYYFARFLERFPTVKKLAAADLEEVMRLWAGLGYYSRANNLYKAAQAVVAAGKWPECAADWQKLPGVGKSTAAALAGFCNDESVAVCDGNVRRVLSRVAALKTPADSTQGVKFLEELAQSLVNRTEPGRYNQAMMDLGAMLCTRTSPKCMLCPVNDFCLAYEEGNPADYPVKRKKVAKKERTVFAGFFADSDGVRLVKRSLKGYWPALWSLPEFESKQGQEITRFVHEMTHITLTYVIFALDAGSVPEDAFVVSAKELADAPVPAPLAKVLNFVSFGRGLP